MTRHEIALGLGWNVKVGRPSHAVAQPLGRWVREHRPAVVGLMECYTLGALGLTGYVLADEHGGGSPANTERRDVRLYVRDDVKVLGSGVVAHDEPWVGPKVRKRHVGRVHRWVDLDLGGTVVRVLVIHRISGRRMQPNRKAWAAETALLRAFIRDSPHPTFVFGDTNDSPTRNRLWARVRAGARFIAGHGVDGAYGRGISARSVDLGSGDSDHHAILYLATLVAA